MAILSATIDVRFKSCMIVSLSLLSRNAILILIPSTQPPDCMRLTAISARPLVVNLSPPMPSRKPTDLWTNSSDIWIPRPHTRRGLHRNAPVFDADLADLQAKYGKRVEEVPKRENVRRFGDSGVYHEWGPRGAKTGTQGIKPLALPSGIRIPKYHMKSLIPYGLGEDTIVAVERALAGIKGAYPVVQRGDEKRNTLFDY